jgi:hypothetical protein
VSRPAKVSSPEPITKTSSIEAFSPAISRDPSYQYRNWFTLGILEMNVIHRFRNLLMSMMGNVSFIREEMSKGNSPEKFLSELEQSLSEASQYSNWVQNFGEKQKANLIRTDLNLLVNDSVKALQHPGFFSVPIQLELDPSIPPILTDPFLLKLSLWELIHQYRLPSNTNGYSLSPCEKPLLRIKTQVVTEEKTNCIRPKIEDFIELLIESEGLQNSYVPPELSPGYKKPLPFGSPSLEITKTIMRIFHGEVKFIIQDGFHERTCLKFPIENT